MVHLRTLSERLAGYEAAMSAARRAADTALAGAQLAMGELATGAAEGAAGLAVARSRRDEAYAPYRAAVEVLEGLSGLEHEVSVTLRWLRAAPRSLGGGVGGLRR